MSPLLLLTLLRLRGRFRRWLRMVKQPKYVIGMLVMLAYWSWFILGRGMSHRPGSSSEWMTPESLAALRLLASTALAGVLSIGFILRTRQPLVFDESEIQHLFTAPIARRSLVRYALFKVQPPILLGSAFSTLVIARGSLAERLERWPSVWLTFTLMFLWSNAIGLWKARIDELPAPRAMRRRIATWGALAAFWATVAALGWMAWRDVVASGTFSDFEDVRRIAGVLAHERLLQIVLAPIELPLHAVLASSLGERAIGWAAAAFVAVALTEWCARSPVRFEEGALERARQVAEIRTKGLGATSTRKASAKARALRPFALGALGRPETAIVWKNLLLIGRTSLRRASAWSALALAVPLALTALLRAPVPIVATLVSISLMLAIMTTISAGAFWRNDLRVDLLHVDQLRTWPISGSRLVASEIVAPTIATTALALWCLALAFGTMLVASFAGRGGGAAFRELAAGAHSSRIGLVLMAFVAAIPLVAALSFLSAAIQNATVLLVPGWSRLGRVRTQGAAIAGQQLVLGLARLLAMAVGLAPGALAVVVVLAVQHALGIGWRAWELPPLALVLATPVALESLLLVRWCGHLWDRLDPSRELLEGESG